MGSLLLLVLAALSILLLVDSKVTLVSNAEWAAYKREFNKHYAPEHDYIHRWRYSSVVAKVRKNNMEYDQGNVTFFLKVNEFSDTDRSALFANAPSIPEESTMAPQSKPCTYKYYHEIQGGIDWRKSGFVSAVKNQGNCNSCWAFSSAGVLEAHLAKKTGKRVALSPKHLLDCVKENIGCYGGWVSHALNYTRDNGISSRNSYPYKPENETCKYDPRNTQGSPKGYVILEPDEKKMAEVVYNIGPVTVSIDNLFPEFYEYSKGILNIPECRHEKDYLKHSMLVVGFGTDLKGRDYWLIKNSFGKSWGEHGYLRLARNAGNMCGVASLAQYPVF